MSILQKVYVNVNYFLLPHKLGMGKKERGELKGVGVLHSLFGTHTFRFFLPVQPLAW